MNVNNVRYKKGPLQIKKLFLLFSFLLVTVVVFGISIGNAKELPILVEISEISEIYDGKRITVFGWVRSAEVKTGRRGSLHLEIVVGRGAHNVYVYTIKPVSNIIDRGIIVQGIYHEQGRFAGRHVENFIEADAIVSDWSAEK